MTISDGAGLEHGEGQEQGVAPPADGSQGDGGKPPGDGITKQQLAAALNSQERKLRAEFEETLKRERDQGKANDPKPPTRAELLAMVDRGDLTQAQADALWEKQLTERVKREAAAEVGAALGVQDRTRRVEAVLAEYREVVGDAWVEGTKERAKVAAEFKHLVEVLGYPPTKETEAAALRAAFGDVAALRASKSAKAGSSETHAETGGSKPSGEGGSKDPVKALDARQRAYYQRGIDNGRYRDWDAVREELKFARSRAKG